LEKLIEFKGVSKIYTPDIPVLKDINFSLHKGEFLFIVGSPGSGKSTLFRLITMEETPSSGDVIVFGENTKNLRERKKAYLRRKMGLILEDLKLLQDRSVIENVILPLEIDGIPRKKALEKAKNFLGNLGISGVFRRKVEEISTGEALNILLARALIREIDLLLVDEPIENLNEETYELLKEENRKGVAVIVATRSENSSFFVPYAKIMRIDRGILIQ